MNLKSQEEKDFNDWCLELKKMGYISQIVYEPKPISLSEPVKRTYIKKLKTKSLEKDEHLLHAHEYTYDFDIYWTKKALNTFICLDNSNDKKGDLLLCNTVSNLEMEEDDSYLTHIEIKGSFDYQNMSRLVMLNIKWAKSVLDVYINLVKIPDYFKKTFCPINYLTTKTGKPKKINFKVRTLEEYLKNVKS